MHYFNTLHTSPTYYKLNKFRSDSVRAEEQQSPRSANKKRKEREAMWLPKATPSAGDRGEDQSVTKGGTPRFLFHQTLDWIQALPFCEHVVDPNKEVLLI